MKNLKTLSLITALGLLLVVPALAQLPEEEQQPAETQPVEQTAPAETQPVEETAPAESESYQASAEAPAQETSEATAEETEPAESESASLDEGMPQTASPLALIALLGAAGIGSASGLRYLRRK